MGRVLKSKLQVHPAQLNQQSTKIRQTLVQRQQTQKYFYDRRSKPLPLLKEGEAVRVKHDNEWKRAVVLEKHHSPRSFIVQTEEGSKLRRNRRDLIQTNETPRRPSTYDADSDLSESTSDSTNTQLQPSSTVLMQPIQHLKVAVQEENLNPVHTVKPLVVTRSGRTVQPPVKFQDYVT